MNNQVSLKVVKAIIAICFFSMLSSAHATDGKPVAVVEKDSFDFGTRFEGVDIIQNYIIKNNGDADLKILSVKSG